jgi:hypothetical protein
VSAVTSAGTPGSNPENIRWQLIFRSAQMRRIGRNHFRSAGRNKHKEKSGQASSCILPHQQRRNYSNSEILAARLLEPTQGGGFVVSRPSAFEFRKNTRFGVGPYPPVESWPPFRVSGGVGAPWVRREPWPLLLASVPQRLRWSGITTATSNGALDERGAARTLTALARAG